MKKLNKKGFTLIELLAVIVILGVLMLVAIPAVTKYIDESRKKTFISNASSIIDAAINQYNFENMSSSCNMTLAKINLEKKLPSGYAGYVAITAASGSAPTSYAIYLTDGTRYLSNKTADQLSPTMTLDTSATTTTTETCYSGS